MRKKEAQKVELPQKRLHMGKKDDDRAKQTKIETNEDAKTSLIL